VAAKLVAEEKAVVDRVVVGRVAEEKAMVDRVVVGQVAQGKVEEG